MGIVSASLMVTALNIAPVPLAPGESLVPPRHVRAVALCVASITGDPLPATLPVVIRSPQWTLEASGFCCSPQGATAQARAGYAPRALALTSFKRRTTWLSASGGDVALAHELAVWLRMHTPAANGKRHPRIPTDAWAYSIARQYPFEDCSHD